MGSGEKKEKEKEKNKGKERQYVCVDRFGESGEQPADPVVEMWGAWTDTTHTQKECALGLEGQTCWKDILILVRGGDIR